MKNIVDHWGRKKHHKMVLGKRKIETEKKKIKVKKGDIAYYCTITYFSIQLWKEIKEKQKVYKYPFVRRDGKNNGT
jgi:hypothetical protein